MRSLGVRGFTLIELMVTVTIMVIIGGTAYTSYNAVIRVYQKHQQRLETVQKCRAALEQIARDLENLFYVPGDEESGDEFALTSFDSMAEEGMDQDEISFVRMIDPRYEFYQFVQSEEEEEWTLSSLEASEGTPVNTDLIRVGYLIGENPELSIYQSSSNLSQGAQSIPSMSIYRITTHTVSYDDGLSQVFEGDITPAEAAQMADTADPEEYDSMYRSESQLSATSESEALIKSEVVIDSAMMLDFRFYDGEDWLDTWEGEEGIPRAVMVTISATDEKGEISITEATLVYLKISEAIEAAQEAAAAEDAGPGGGGPGGGDR
jgi:prepilin-type N-terminal cleavage/methylation domain-containing protein